MNAEDEMEHGTHLRMICRLWIQRYFHRIYVNDELNLKCQIFEDIDLDLSNEKLSIFKISQCNIIFFFLSRLTIPQD